MADSTTPTATPPSTGSPIPRQPGPLKRPGDDTVVVAPRGTTQRATASNAHEGIQPKRMGFDATRPFRYAWAFVGGTLWDMFDGMANVGRTGIWLGMAVGALCAIGGGGFVLFGYAASGIIGNLFGGAVAGALAGIVIGGVKGALTGGYKGVGRAHRKEKYADELAVREEIRGGERTTDPSFRDVHARNEVAANYNYDRMQQAMQENRRDDSRYWRDTVDTERQHSMGEHHHGF